MSIEAMRQALEALETLARYENPETRIQARKPKDGGPIVTMYPHKVATDAADAIRTAIEQAEKQEPVAWMNRHGACKTSLFREVEAGAKDEYTIPLYTTPPAAQRQPPRFPTMLRKMWSGREVQEWINENGPTAQRQPLTAGEISLLWKRHTNEDGQHLLPYEDDGLGFARAIEAKIKEKNT